MAKFRNKKTKKIVEPHSKFLIEKFEKDERYEKVEEKAKVSEKKS